MAEKVTIGNAELWHGDCREVLPLLEVVDAIVSDPPYGIGADKGASTGGTDASGRYLRRPKQYDGDWDSARPGADDLAAVVAAAKSCVLWGGNYFADILPKGGRWLFWDKLNSMPSYSDGEMAWTNIRGVAVKKFTACNNGLASLRDGERVHPTQKPVALMAWCIGLLPDAKVICDPYMGSGSTGVAAVRMGRRFVGIELDRRYFDAACERIENEQRQCRLAV